MSVSDLALDPKTRAVIPLAFLLILLGGAVSSTWYIANMKNGIENSMQVFELKLAGVERNVESLVDGTKNRYTSDEASKDWRNQTIINEQVQKAVDALEDRVRELELRSGPFRPK